MFFLFKEILFWGGVLLEFDRKWHKKRGKMSVCNDFLPSLDGLFNNLIDVWQVTSFVIIVETVSYDEIVFDVEASVVDLEIYLQATWLDEE